ncbi:MAG: PCRF domain-containing protein [Candidatus Paceibacterota bacterium]
MKEINKINLEIRAGTGGDEATLFAEDLARMYKKYSENKNWKFKVTDFSRSEGGGFKSLVANIKGKGVYDDLKNESGVHRVQRVPETEKSGRTHTSTASVAVLPEVKPEEVDISSSDLEMTFFRSSGPGGQNVNKVETAVRIRHIPTDIIVASQDERSQARNREKAMGILIAKVYEYKTAEKAKEMGAMRKDQIGSAERAEKIRTYNFPQNRVTDHRINKKWHKLDKIIEGELDGVVRVCKKGLK